MHDDMARKWPRSLIPSLILFPRGLFEKKYDTEGLTGDRELLKKYIKSATDDGHSWQRPTHGNKIISMFLRRQETE